MSEAASHRDFMQNLATAFRIAPVSTEPMELTLAQVSELRTSPGQENFSIVFRGPIDRLLSQGTYTLAHDRLGEQDIFLVPVARDEQGISYEAVFNRLI